MLISQLPVEESLSSLTACARLRQVISRPSGLAHATVLLVEEHVRPSAQRLENRSTEEASHGTISITRKISIFIQSRYKHLILLHVHPYQLLDLSSRLFREALFAASPCTT